MIKTTLSQTTMNNQPQPTPIKKFGEFQLTGTAYAKPAYEIHETVKTIVENAKTKYYSLEIFYKILREEYLNKNQDVMVLITGFKGKGKSSLALRSLQVYYKVYFPQVNVKSEKFLRKHISFSTDPQEIKNMIKNTQRYHMLVFDEAGRFLLGEDWAKKEHRQLKKVFAEVRTKNLIYLLNCPYKIQWIDKKYVGSLFEFWIQVFDWDKAIIFRRNNNPASLDYDLSVFEKRIKFIPSTLTRPFWVRMRSKIRKYSPNYFGEIRWGKPDEHFYAKYQKLRDEAVWGVGENPK